MTITVTVSDPDIILDEEAGYVNETGDDDVDPTTFGLQDSALETFLLSLAGSSTAFPQYAMQADYLHSTGTVDAWKLVADDVNGDPFGTADGEGIDSGFTDLDGNTIFLFAYGSNTNVVLGRVGNGTNDNPTGAVAFAVVLDEQTDGTVDMWTIQYQPFQHPIAGAVDSNDFLDLAGQDGLIFAEATTTTTGPTTLLTSDTISRQGFDLPGQEGASKEIMNSLLREGDSDTSAFYVQFTGDHATGGKTGIPLTARPGGTNASYQAGDLFQGSSTSIQVTNSTNGVAGDTIQNGEVLDFDFYDHDPGNVINQTPDQFATGIFLKFDGLTGKEDIVVILKLADANNPDGGVVTTKAIVVESSDIYRNGEAYPTFDGAISLDNNDGLVIIDQADYNLGSDNYVIVGAQVLSSTEKVSGSGINLGKAMDDPDTVAVEGGSSGTTTFGKTGGTVDTDVIKISNIGFILPDTPTETVKEYVDVGAHLIFEDDGPHLSTPGTQTFGLTTDDTDLIDTDSVSVANLDFGTTDYGVDGPADTDPLTYRMDLSSEDADSGLVDTLTKDAVLLETESGTGDIVGYVLDTDGTTHLEVLRFHLDSGTGTITLTQSRAVVHEDVDDPDEDTSTTAATLLAGLVSIIQTATDGDGDSLDVSSIDLADVTLIYDDGPSITSTSDADYDGASAQGVFVYDLGGDGRIDYTGESDFGTITFTGTAGGDALVYDESDPNVSEGTATLISETDETAQFSFSFSYDPNPDPNINDLSSSTGTLTFNKVDGTYTVEVAIEGFTTFQTSEQEAKFEYNLVGTPQQSEIVVEQLNEAGTFFVKFTGDGATNKVPVTYSGGLFSAADTWVSATQASNGVAGDTIQKGEILDLSFWDANPQVSGSGADANPVDNVFLKFFQIGTTEDLVVVLKLVSASDPTDVIYRNVIVSADDIYRFDPDTNVIPAEYQQNISLDGNADSAVIIESNDYNFGNDDYQIVAMQIVTSVEGANGTGINLDGGTGEDGASSSTLVAFGAAATDNDVVKIVDIGFVQLTTGVLDLELDFTVPIVDGDGDSTSATLHVGPASTLLAAAAPLTMEMEAGHDLMHWNVLY